MFKECDMGKIPRELIFPKQGSKPQEIKLPGIISGVDDRTRSEPTQPSAYHPLGRLADKLDIPKRLPIAL